MTTSLLTRTGFVTAFRAAIFNHFKDYDVLFLDAIEKNCLSLIQRLFTQDNRAFFTILRIHTTAASCALIHPQLARLFFQLVPQVRIQNTYMDILAYLDIHSSPEKFLALWMKWKKDPRNVFVSFLKFQEYWVKRVVSFFQEGMGSSESLHYFEHLAGESCKYFSFEFIEIHALKKANHGIKAFATAQYAEATTYFHQAIQLNPGCALCYWNLARLAVVVNAPKATSQARKWYREALLHVNDRKLSKAIKAELHLLSTSQSDQIESIPVQIRT